MGVSIYSLQRTRTHIRIRIRASCMYVFGGGGGVVAVGRERCEFIGVCATDGWGLSCSHSGNVGYGGEMCCGAAAVALACGTNAFPCNHLGLVVKAGWRGGLGLPLPASAFASALCGGGHRRIRERLRGRHAACAAPCEACSTAGGVLGERSGWSYAGVKR